MSSDSYLSPECSREHPKHVNLVSCFVPALFVDSNNTYTAEEKETAKDTLTKITELVASTGSAAGKVALFLPLLAKIFSNSFIIALAPRLK